MRTGAITAYAKAISEGDTTMEERSGKTNRKHILVVDDDIELALTFESLLQLRGFETSAAANGLEALRVIQRQQVDAILCDLNMPELSGDLFYLEVGRVRPQLLQRFVFITGNADSPLYRSFLQSVEAPVVGKPVSFDRLLEALQKVLGA
jgi:CheY-like chemotaxis protein